MFANKMDYTMALNLIGAVILLTCIVSYSIGGRDTDNSLVDPDNKLVKRSEPGISQKLFNFTSFYNGNFENKVQTEQTGDDHDLILFKIIPVDIQCVGQDPAVYFEQHVNGVLKAKSLAVITDDRDDRVSLRVYTFTDSAKYTLPNIPCEDVQEVKDCVASYKVSREGFLYGNFPHCGYTINGEHPRFTDMVTCNSFTSTFPLHTEVKSPIQPYEFQLTSQKYQLIYQPEGFVDPCDN